MGEAKSRGTLEDRIAQAKAKKEAEDREYAYLNLGAVDKADHFAVIFDNSETGRKALAHLSGKMPRLAAKNLLREGLEWQFLVYVWSKKFSGDFTAIAKNKEMLVSGALPAVNDKMRAMGGFCAYVPAVDRKLLPEIMAALAVLQPTEGTERH